MRRILSASFGALLAGLCAAAPGLAQTTPAPPPVLVESQTVSGAVLTARPAPVRASAKPSAFKGWGGQVRYTAALDFGIMRGSSQTLDPVSMPYAGLAKNGRGFQGAVSVGAEVGRDWAFGLEGQYLEQERDIYMPDGSLSLGADHAILAAFVTAQYRLPVAGYLRPYLGAGVGGALSRFKGGDVDAALAAKASLGVDVAIGETVSLYGQYDVIYLGETDHGFGSYGDMKVEDAFLYSTRLGLKKRF